MKKMDTIDLPRLRSLLHEWERRLGLSRNHLMVQLCSELRELINNSTNSKEMGYRTWLVASFYRKLGGEWPVSDEMQQHFYCSCARAIRMLLTEELDRGQDSGKLGLEVSRVAAALQLLEELDPKQVFMIELRYFLGLTLEQMAEVMQLELANARKQWRLARAWIHAIIHNRI